jgi:flagellar motor switch protein FliN/FliY
MPAPLLTPEIIEQIRGGTGEAAEAWKRAFDLQGEVSSGEPTELLSLVAQESWNAPGLAVVFSQPSGAYALLVADVGNTLPTWTSAPDATGTSKLATLAQELGLILLPEALMPTAGQAARIENLQEALLRCEPAAGVEGLTLQLRCGEITLPAVLLGVSDSGKLLPLPSTPVAESSRPAAESVPIPPVAAPKATPVSSRFSLPPRPQEFEDGIPALPSYTRSLLKIRVPVVASLATTQIPVGRILEIGPGSIIQFNQSCEQPLSLAIGEHEFAVGEAVKVGEKFGLRITSMVMPSERFWSVRGRRE